METKVYAVLGPSFPLPVSGWQKGFRKQQLCNQNALRLKNGATRLNLRFSLARPRKFQLKELSPKYTGIYCVFESGDFSAESVPQTNFYMGDANNSVEEIEEPAKYVPPPPLNQEDSQMIGKAEKVLYFMKDYLCTFLQKHKADQNCYAVRKLFSRTVEFQDPVICFRGTKSLIWWLDALSDAPIVVNINEIYNQYKAKAKPRIYIIWTVTLKNQDLEIQDLWREEYMQLLHCLHNQENGNQNPNEMDRNSSPLDLENYASVQEHNGRHFGLSGEAKLEINSLGQIASIHISWYLLRNKSAELQLVVKQLLVALLSRKS